MDTDARKRGGGSLASILGFLVIIALLAVLVWAVLREGDAEVTTGDGGTESCETQIMVRVTTTEEFAPVVEAAADRLEDDDERCARYAVSTASSAVTAEQIRTGTDVPDVWIPDSDVWVERVNQADAPALTAGPTLATSLVVLAVPSSLAESSGMSGPQPWQAILTGPLQVRIGDPEESTASLLLLHAAEQALSGTPQGEQLLGAEIIRMSRQSVPENELLAQASADGEGATAVVATEQQIFQQRAENPDVSLEAVVPAEGTGTLTYSWVPVPRPDQDADVQRAVSDLEQSLTGVAGVADRQEAGFRLPDGGEAPGVPGIPAGTAATVQVESVAEADAVVTLWNTVAVDMRMLAVIDVSGSMLEPVGDQTRIELAGASAQAAMQIFPPTSQVGLWIFSTERASGNDWTELVPIAPLDAESSGGTHRDTLLNGAATLPDHTVEGGDTGLYDTVLAAYREVQENYEPGYVNSVVLLTDGVNEDEDSLSLGELLAELQASIDPRKPIPIITVGMGTGTDEEVLRTIAAQTGGRSYLARDPADISTVFVDALTHRFRAG